MHQAWRAVVVLTLLAAGSRLPVAAQLPEAVGPCPEALWTPRTYACPAITAAPRIDGKLDDACWREADWSEPFVDIRNDRFPAPRRVTRIKMAWDQRAWYIAAELDEPHVWGDIREHDAVIFHNNDFEVFVDPDGDNHRYGELELNALNTTWDLFLDKPYKDGGQADNAWEIAGLQTAVEVRGSINDPRDIDEGWTVEIAIPFSGLRRLGVEGAPQPGAVWRVNFSRVQWRHQVVEGKYRRTPETAEDNWVWSRQGVVNMHRPETWGYLVFQDAASRPAAWSDDDYPAKWWLHQVYYLQKDRRARGGEWASSLAMLPAPPPPAGWRSGLEADEASFHVRLEKEDRAWSIDHTSRLRPGRQ